MPVNVGDVELVTRFCGPRADSREPIRRDSGDAARDARIKRVVAIQRLFGPSFVYTKTDDSERCGIVDDDDENQFASGQRSRYLRGRRDAKRPRKLN